MLDKYMYYIIRFTIGRKNFNKFTHFFDNIYGLILGSKIHKRCLMWHTGEVDFRPYLVKSADLSHMFTSMSCRSIHIPTHSKLVANLNGWKLSSIHTMNIFLTHESIHIVLHDIIGYSSSKLDNPYMDQFLFEFAGE